jgi:outer membrane receptor protein involved in Fe transport
MTISGLHTFTCVVADTVWDVRGYWRVTDHLLTTAGIENFTDKNFREHLNFTSQNGLVQVFQPGLNAYVGAELRY